MGCTEKTKTFLSRLHVTSSEIALPHGRSFIRLTLRYQFRTMLSTSFNGNAGSEKCSKSRDIYLIVSSARARALQLQPRRLRGAGGAKLGELHLWLGMANGTCAFALQTLELMARTSSLSEEAAGTMM